MRAAMLAVRAGCSSWTSPAWNGRFYPRGLPDGERLGFYARHFDTVEVDATYYAPPNPFVVRGWARKTPEGFLFSLKLTRELFDPKSPLDAERLAGFVEAARGLGPKLGPILIQFPPWFRAPRTPGQGHGGFLERLLRELPSGAQYVVELRDGGWFGGAHRVWLERTLGERAVASCWSSLTYVEVPPIRTTPWAYLRFIGDHVTVPAEVHGEIRVDRTRETRAWAARLQEAELESAFAYFNNHFAGYGPASVQLFREEMGLPVLPLPEASPVLPSPPVQRRLAEG
jgi:uncharacterized protein YecE (DUF72 family)